MWITVDATSTRSSLRPKPSMPLSLVCSLKSSMCTKYTKLPKCSCGTKITQQFKLVFVQAEAMWTTFIHGITWNLEPNLRLTIWLWHEPTNPMIQTPLESDWPKGPIDIHINNWCNCTWTGNLINLQFTIHKFTNPKSHTCLDSGISCLTGQWFFVLVLHKNRHSNPTMDYKWPKKKS